MSAPTRIRREPITGDTPDGDFRHRAACRNADPESFFPSTKSGSEHDEQVAAAKNVCAGCPVRTECLAWALLALPYGIAAGITEDERRVVRARSRKPRRSCLPLRLDGATPSEIAAAGHEAIRAGRQPRAVAREFGVSPRTGDRWAAEVRRAAGDQTVSTAEGSAGGNRAPLLISQQCNTQAGNRTTEGVRS